MRNILLVLAVRTAAACVPKSQLEVANAELASLEEQAGALNNQLLEAKARADGIEAQYNTAKADLEALLMTYDQLQADYNTSQGDLRDSKSDVNRLSTELEKYVCQDQIEDMKYSSILDASTIMAAWWARQPSVLRVQGTYRDSIWSNADTKIHAIRYISSEDNQEYVEHFLVYFNEFGWGEGVFWVSGQCWLDR